MKRKPTSQNVAAHVGPIIRRARLAAGLTQNELGIRLGLAGKSGPRSGSSSAAISISTWESGRILPTLVNLFALAAALGLHPKELLDETAEFEGA